MIPNFRSPPIVGRMAGAVARRLVAGGRALMLVPSPEEQLLADYRFAADPAPRPRLNLVVPDISAGQAFGGVMTGLDLFFALAAELARRLPIDLRIILTASSSSQRPPLLAQFAANHGVEVKQVALLPLSGDKARVPLRASDLLLTFNWSATLNMSRLVAAQAKHFGTAKPPILYLIQEYEPHLLPFSSAQMLANDAYRVDRLWGIFNSTALHAYFKQMGHRVEHAMVFEPLLNRELRPFLREVQLAKRARQIVVYGRPAIDRNCFPALVRGLRRWADRFPEYSDWNIVSAGTKHRPVALGDGRSIQSLGKLELPEYARLLLDSSAGVSLMASPHPSYPPLEMAHFGVRTVTNRFGTKDWTSGHPNLIAIDSVDADAVAEALAEACASALQGPPASDPASDFLREDDYPGLKELAPRLRKILEAES